MCGLPVSCGGPEWAGLWGVAEPACTFIKVKNLSWEGLMWCHSGSVHHLYTVYYVRCDEQEAVSPLDWLYMFVQSCFWGHLLVVRKDCRFKARCYSHLLYTVCGRGSFLTFFVLLCKDLRFVLSCVKTMTLLWNHIQPLALHTRIISSIYLYWELACMAKNNLVLKLIHISAHFKHMKHAVLWTGNLYFEHLLQRIKPPLPVNMFDSLSCLNVCFGLTPFWCENRNP